MRRTSAVVTLLCWLISPVPTMALMLAWDGSTGATGYALHYGTAPRTYTTMLDTGAATSASVDGLSPGTTYYFGAVAYNEAGTSPFSNEVAHAIPSGDQIPPSVAILVPANGAVVSRKSQLTIQADASDNISVAQVIITVLNGTSVIERCIDQTAPYTCQWVVPPARKKRYQIHAVALDGDGNISQPAIVEVRVL